MLIWFRGPGLRPPKKILFFRIKKEACIYYVEGQKYQKANTTHVQLLQWLHGKQQQQQGFK